MNAPLSAPRRAGRHDHAARRRSQRRGRETGCWVYITGDELTAGGFTSAEPAPFYRVWGGPRARYIVTLYRDE